MRRSGRRSCLNGSHVARSVADACAGPDPSRGWVALAWLGAVFAACVTSGARAEEPDGGLFRTSIPAGFEDLSAPQTSLVDVFFLGQHVDVAMATFAPGSFAFVDPEAVVQRLPQIARPGAITLALSGELEPNAALVCGTRSRPGCGTLQPDVAGIIFDADRFRVDVFIDPALLEPQLTQSPRFLPDPEAGFSALETIAVAAAGSTSDGSDFTLRSSSLLAYDTSRLTAETSVSSADGANLDVLAGEVDHRGWRYIGGLYRTALSSLLGERRLLGAGAASSIDTRLDREQVRGSPITVFLPIRAQVEIFREGRLLSSQGYPAGNQVVDTTALPEGAYEVTLRIRQIDGSVREETRFFAKTSAVPPRGAPRYVLEAGWLGTEARCARRLCRRAGSAWRHHASVDRVLGAGLGSDPEPARADPRDHRLLPRLVQHVFLQHARCRRRHRRREPQCLWPPRSLFLRRLRPPDLGRRRWPDRSGERASQSGLRRLDPSRPFPELRFRSPGHASGFGRRGTGAMARTAITGSARRCSCRCRRCSARGST